MGQRKEIYRYNQSKNKPMQKARARKIRGSGKKLIWTGDRIAARHYLTKEDGGIIRVHGVALKNAYKDDDGFLVCPVRWTDKTVGEMIWVEEGRGYWEVRDGCGPEIKITPI